MTHAATLGARYRHTDDTTDPLPSRLVPDRAALLEALQFRRRRAQIAARHALDAPEVAAAEEPGAS